LISPTGGSDVPRISIINWIASSLSLSRHRRWGVKERRIFAARANTAITPKLMTFRVPRNVDNDNEEDDGGPNELMKFI